MRLSSIMSLLPSGADYAGISRTWRVDLVAGLTVGIVALPLALGFGEASGVGVAAGLVTAIVAGLVAAVFGGSHVQVSGPTGAMVVVLAPIVAKHGVASVAVVSAMAGVVLVLIGVLRLGRLVGMIPWPVIEGFTVGIAFIIAAQQIPATVDAHAKTGQNAVVAAIGAIVHHGAHLGWTLGTAALVAAIMIVVRRLRPRLPDSLIAVTVATLATQLMSAPLARIGHLPDTLPAPALPDLAHLSLVGSLGSAALSVAALAAIESLLSAKVASQMTDVGRLQPDRELVGQGLASLACGMFGGMPATGAIARTAVNVSSGGRSRLSAITHAVVLIAVVYALSPIVSRIPLAALSGVLIVVAMRMVDREAVATLLRSTRTAAVVFTTTALITVAFDLLDAVVIGVALAVVLTLRRLALSGGVRRDALPGAACAGDDRIALVTLTGPVFFAATERLRDDVLAIGPTEVMILRLSQLSMLDASGARGLGELIHTLHRSGSRVQLLGMRQQDLPLLQRTGAIESVAPDDVFDDLDTAVEHARGLIGPTGLPPQFRRPD